LLAVPHYAQLL
jgi:hypothetical protein